MELPAKTRISPSEFFLSIISKHIPYHENNRRSWFSAVHLDVYWLVTRMGAKYTLGVNLANVK